MSKSLRLPVFPVFPVFPVIPVIVLAITMAFGARPALAQTVVVKAAPAGAPIELTVNSGSPQSATADESGSASLSVSVPAGVDTSGVRFFIETCTPRVRVVMVTVGMAVPSSECLRTDIPWVFVMRSETSFLVDLEGSSPMVLVRQGSVPREWMIRAIPGQPLVLRVPVTPPTGLSLSGQIGLGGFRRTLDLACGTAACSRDRTRRDLGLAATYWLSPNLAAEVGFAKLDPVRATGSGTGFSFSSALDAQLLTLAANLGAPVGRSRPYAKAGVNYHQALYSQTYIIDTTTVPGGVHTSQVKTTGWGWLFGGGVEVWLTPSVALYTEGQVAWVRGADTAGGEAKIRDYLTMLMVGGRIHLWR